MYLRYSSYRSLQDANDGDLPVIVGDGDEFVTEAPQTQTEPPCPLCQKAVTNNQPLLNGGSYWYSAVFVVFVVLAAIVMAVAKIREWMQARRDAAEQIRSDKLPKDEESKRKYLQQQFAHQRIVMTVQAPDVLAPPVVLEEKKDDDDEDMEDQEEDDKDIDKAPPSAQAEPLTLDTLHVIEEDGQDGVSVAATDRTLDGPPSDWNPAKSSSTEDLSNLVMEGQTTVEGQITVDSADPTTNSSSTGKSPAVQDETIVKAGTMCTKIDIAKGSETKESEKSYIPGIGADETRTTDVEAQTTELVCTTNSYSTASNTGSAGRGLAQELEQDDENTYLCLPCHHDPEKTVRKGKPAAASGSPKFLDKLQWLSRKSKDTATKKTEEEKTNQTRPRMVPNLCAICLESYQSDDRVVWSNHCQHAFHQDCVVQCWLSQNKEDWTYHQSFSCPTCRQEFMVLHDDERASELTSGSNDRNN